MDSGSKGSKGSIDPKTGKVYYRFSTNKQQSQKKTQHPEATSTELDCSYYSAVREYCPFCRCYDRCDPDCPA